MIYRSALVLLFIISGSLLFFFPEQSGSLERNWLIYLIQLWILLELIQYISKKINYAVSLSQELLVFLFWGIATIATQIFFPGYRDLIVNRLGHLIYGVLATTIAIKALTSYLSKTSQSINKSFFFFITFTLASTGGVFCEIIELMLDTFTGSHRLGPRPDTAIDLLTNTIGILASLFFFKNILPITTKK